VQYLSIEVVMTFEPRWTPDPAFSAYGVAMPHSEVAGLLVS
jgi:hypothetical protein